MSSNPVADAIAAAQFAVSQGEAAALLDVDTGEGSVAAVTTQARAAYQLVIEILQNGQVELAPALIALEIAAISEGVAAYLAEQTTAAAIERAVQAKTAQVNQEIAPAYQAFVQSEGATYLADVEWNFATYQEYIKRSGSISAVMREALDRATSGVRDALGEATGSAARSSS